MKIQPILSCSTYLWHRLNIFFYQCLGAFRLAEGMPPPQSPEAASLLALCRKTNIHICRAMEIRQQLQRRL